MKTKYVILKSKSHLVTRDPFAGTFSYFRGLEMEPSVFKVNVEEVDTRDLPLLSRDSSVLALAPA